MDFNDKMSSYWCGAKIMYDFAYHLAETDHTKGLGDSGAGTASNHDIYNENDYTSVLLRPYDAYSQGAVVLYTGSDCSGSTGRFLANEDLTQSAFYNSNDMWEHNMWHKWVSSLRVPYGYVVELYSNNGYSGDKRVIEGDFPGENFESKCINIYGDPYHFNNDTESLRIYRNNEVGLAKGYWSSITATTMIEFEMSFGMQIEKPAEDKSTAEEDFNR